MVEKLPSDFDIFSPPIVSIPQCSHTRANPLPGSAHRLCARSFSWCGNSRSPPPPWMSNVSPRWRHAIALHSMCHPGRPRPHGLSHPGKSGVLGFHSTKSPASRL